MAINLTGKRVSFPDIHREGGLPVLDRTTRKARTGGLYYRGRPSNDSADATNSEADTSDKRRCQSATSSDSIGKA